MPDFIAGEKNDSMLAFYGHNLHASYEHHKDTESEHAYLTRQDTDTEGNSSSPTEYICFIA